MTATEVPTELERPEEDPRIRDRRVEVQRAADRRRARWFQAFAGVFIVGGLGYLATESPLLDVDRVTVRGTQRVSGEDVLAAANVQLGVPLLRVDTSAIEQRVGELAWVDDVRVVRDWPGTVRIEVDEFDATAFVRRANGDAALLAADGRVVADVQVVPDGVVEVLGMRRPPRVGGYVSPAGAPGIVTRLPEALLARVVAIDLAGDDVALDLEDGGEIRLGDLDAVEAKGEAALAVLDQIAGAPFSYIDVRVPEAPALCCDGR